MIFKTPIYLLVRSKVGKNNDVIGGYGAVDSDATIFLGGNGMDANPVEI